MPYPVVPIEFAALRHTFAILSYTVVEPKRLKIAIKSIEFLNQKMSLLQNTKLYFIFKLDSVVYSVVYRRKWQCLSTFQLCVGQFYGIYSGKSSKGTVDLWNQDLANSICCAMRYPSVGCVEFRISNMTIDLWSKMLRRTLRFSQGPSKHLAPVIATFVISVLSPIRRLDFIVLTVLLSISLPIFKSIFFVWPTYNPFNMLTLNIFFQGQLRSKCMVVFNSQHSFLSSHQFLSQYLSVWPRYSHFNILALSIFVQSQPRSKVMVALNSQQMIS
jgi:hypothetical protein